MSFETLAQFGLAGVAVGFLAKIVMNDLKHIQTGVQQLTYSNNSIHDLLKDIKKLLEKVVSKK